MDKLIIEAKNGDQKAIEELVGQYKWLIRSLANRYFLVGGDKDDLLQEGMLGMFCAINNYDEQKGPFPAFAKLCVTRQVIDAVKRDGADKNKPLYNYINLDYIDDSGEIGDSPLDSVLRKETSEKIREAINKNLSKTEKTVLRLFSEGYSYEEITGITNKSYKAVDGALQRARKKLLMFKE